MNNTSVPDNITDCDLDYIANEIINSGEVESELVTLLEFFQLAYPEKFMDAYQGIWDFETNPESATKVSKNGWFR